MDVVSNKAVDKYYKVNDVNTSNCENYFKVQLQDSAGSSTMTLVLVTILNSFLKLQVMKDRTLLGYNIDYAPCTALQDTGAWQSEICQFFQDIMVNRETCQLQSKESHFPKEEDEQSLNKYFLIKPCKKV